MLKNKTALNVQGWFKTKQRKTVSFTWNQTQRKCEKYAEWSIAFSFPGSVSPQLSENWDQ